MTHHSIGAIVFELEIALLLEMPTRGHLGLWPLKVARHRLRRAYLRCENPLFRFRPILLTETLAGQIAMCRPALTLMI